MTLELSDMDSAMSSGECVRTEACVANISSDATGTSSLATPQTCPADSHHRTIAGGGSGGAVIFLREEGVRTFVPVCRSHSVTLRELADDLGVSSVLECDADGNVFPRAVAFDSPSDVLHSGHHYVVRRDAAADSGESRVTFRAKITVQEYELDHATPSLLSDSGSGSPFVVAKPLPSESSPSNVHSRMTAGVTEDDSNSRDSDSSNNHSATTTSSGAAVDASGMEDVALCHSQQQHQQQTSMGEAEAAAKRCSGGQESVASLGGAHETIRRRSCSNNAMNQFDDNTTSNNSDDSHAMSNCIASEDNLQNRDKHDLHCRSAGEWGLLSGSARRKRSRDSDGGAGGAAPAVAQPSETLYVQRQKAKNTEESSPTSAAAATLTTATMANVHAVLPTHTRFIPFTADLHGTGVAVTVTLEELQRVCGTATEEQERECARRHECAEEVLTSARRLLFELTGEM